MELAGQGPMSQQCQVPGWEHQMLAMWCSALLGGGGRGMRTGVFCAASLSVQLALLMFRRESSRADLVQS